MNQENQTQQEIEFSRTKPIVRLLFLSSLDRESSKAKNVPLRLIATLGDLIKRGEAVAYAHSLTSEELRQTNLKTKVLNKNHFIVLGEEEMTELDKEFMYQIFVDVSCVDINGQGVEFKVSEE